MSKSAFSLMTYSIYLVGAGLVLVFNPNLMLSIFHTAQTNEVWIRIVGMVVVIIGSLDFMAARSELMIFIRWSVYARFSVPLFFTSFILLGYTSPTPILIFIGVLDAIAAAWTAISLRTEK